jgi:hypothetical protein
MRLTSRSAGDPIGRQLNALRSDCDKGRLGRDRVEDGHAYILQFLGCSADFVPPLGW